MPRVKRSVHARKKRRKVLEQAKGYWGLKSTNYTYAKEQVEHSLTYAYRDRKVRKRMFRRLWIMRINAGARAARALLQPVHLRAEGGRGRARPQGARRPRGQRPRAVRQARRAGEGRARPPSAGVARVITSARQREAEARAQAARAALARASSGSSSARARTSSRPRPPTPVELLVAGENVEPGLLAERLERRPPAAGDRRLPPRRPAGARAAARPSLALWRVADPGNLGTLIRDRRRLRRRGRALGRLRRPDRPEGAARLGRLDLARAARSRSSSRSAAGRTAPLGGGTRLGHTRVALVAGGGTPLGGGRPARRGRASCLGAERDGAAATRSSATARRGSRSRCRVAERRRRRRDRALRVARARIPSSPGRPGRAAR